MHLPHADVSHDPKVAASFGYDKPTGVLVESTLPNAPASRKLEAGDVTESLDGKPVENVLQLRNAIAADSPNSDIKLTIWRNKSEMPVTVKLGTQPRDISMASHNGPAHNEASTDALGLTLTDTNDALARQFNLSDNHEGALVMHVKRGSAAEMAGLRPGELITQIDGKAVKSAAEANELLSQRDVKKGVRLYVTSAKGSRFVVIEAK